MRDFLVFRLMGPMAAFGEIAVGERRGLWDAPSKSAVLGLLAGAMGLCRSDAVAHSQLDQQLGFAVRVDHPGRALRDYHTAQAPTEAARSRRKKAGLPLNTRRDDLSVPKDDISTMLSDRIYRIEAAATVTLWVKQGEVNLDAYHAALQRPKFSPYLGRKSCPLGGPMRPHIVRAKTLPIALCLYDDLERPADIAIRKECNLRSTAWPWPLSFDKTPSIPLWFECVLDDEQDAGLPEGEAREIRLRRDGVRDRALWQFNDRREARIDWPVLVGEGGLQ